MQKMVRLAKPEKMENDYSFMEMDYTPGCIFWQLEWIIEGGMRVETFSHLEEAEIQGWV